MMAVYVVYIYPCIFINVTTFLGGFFCDVQRDFSYTTKSIPPRVPGVDDLGCETWQEAE